MDINRYIIMVEPIVIGIGSNKWLKDANTKLITIRSPKDMQQYSYRTFHDEEENEYVVPSGKKFIILQIGINGEVAGNDNLIKHHTGSYLTGDEDEGTMFWFVMDRGTTHRETLNVYLTIPAGHYINQKGKARLTFTGIETTT